MSFLKTLLLVVGGKWVLNEQVKANEELLASEELNSDQDLNEKINVRIKECQIAQKIINKRIGRLHKKDKEIKKTEIPKDRLPSVVLELRKKWNQRGGWE
jgi:hypothetical protein